MQMFSTSEVARESGVPPHRVSYALLCGKIKEPSRLKGRRAFSPRDLERVKIFFSKNNVRSDGR